MSEETKGNAIAAGTTEHMDTLGKEGDVRLIGAHGLNVGLNDGLMGNSEVGCVFSLENCTSCRSSIADENMNIL